jgi:hypothetical protein
LAEAFRAVRTALYFNTRGSGHRVIQITSPTPSDGKSTLAGIKMDVLQSALASRFDQRGLGRSISYEDERDVVAVLELLGGQQNVFQALAQAEIA